MKKKCIGNRGLPLPLKAGKVAIFNSFTFVMVATFKTQQRNLCIILNNTCYNVAPFWQIQN